MPQDRARLFVALYTDADVSVDLAPAVRRRGYQAQRAAEAGNLALSDEAQLPYATDHGMAILSYTAQDFIPIARAWSLAGREPTGIILSEQSVRTICPNNSASASVASSCGGSFGCWIA